MMKLLSIMALITLSVGAFAQDKVTWTSSYNKEDSTIIITAEIAEGWHLYSQNLENDMGPIPTEISFEANDKVEFSDKTNEPAPKESYDENFGANMSYFEKEVSFTNKVKVKGSTKVSASVVFMICNNEMCLPPTEKIITIEVE